MQLGGDAVYHIVGLALSIIVFGVAAVWLKKSMLKSIRQPNGWLNVVCLAQFSFMLVGVVFSTGVSGYWLAVL